MPKQLTLGQLVKQSYELALEKGWYKKDRKGNLKKRNIPEMLALIHSEISEALEEYRGKRMCIWYGEKGKPEGFPAEIADAIIRLADLAGYLGIDIDEAVKIKHKFNQTRPQRHGGKQC